MLVTLKGGATHHLMVSKPCDQTGVFDAVNLFDVLGYPGPAACILVKTVMGIQPERPGQRGGASLSIGSSRMP